MEGSKFRSLLIRYLPALLAPLAAAAVVRLTWPFFETSPISPFFAAVMVSAWFGGVGPGMVSVVVAFVLADYFFVQPYFRLWPPGRADLVYLASMAGVGAVISFLSGQLHRSRAGFQRSLQRAEQSAATAQTSESRLGGIIDSALDAIITVDSNFRVTVFNQAAERMFRWPSQDAIGETLDRFIPERHRNTHSEHIRAFGRTGVSSRTMAGAREIHGLRSDGTEFPIEASISQVEAGAEKLFTVIMRDVTERERAEERFRQVIEHAPNGMVMVDDRGRISLVNAQIEKSFGYEREELIGQPIEALVPERFRTMHPQYRDGFLAQPTTRSMGTGRDLFGLRKDGSEFPVEIGLNPVETGNGVMVLGTIVDITERKRAERSLRASETKLSGIIQSAMDAIITVDSSQCVMVFNRAAEQMFLCSAADAIGQPLDRFIPQQFREHHSSHVESFGRTGVSTRAMAGARPVFGLRADGTEFPIEASISQIESAGQKIFTVILRDVTERQRAEDRFRQVIEHAPNGMVMVDDRGRISLVNAQIEQSFGYARAELIGQPIEVLVPERFRSGHPQYRDGFIARPTTRSMGTGRDLFGLRKDGSEFPVEIGLNPIQTEQGVMVLGTIVDITERKAAEMASRRLVAIVDSSHDAIVGKDLQGIVTSWNRGAEQIFGYTSAEMVGTSILQIIPEGRRSEENDILTRIREGNRIEQFETVRRTKDGRLIDISVTVSPIVDAAGGIVGVSKVARDITSRKRTENALKESEARLRIVTENARVGLVMVNAERRYTFANTAYAEILELPTADLVGRSVAEVLGAMYESQVAPKLDKAFAGNRVAYELHRSTVDGDRHYAVSYEPLQTERGETLVVVVITDITERKQAEDELSRQRAQLRVIFDSITDGIVVLDRERNIVEANPAGRRLQELTSPNGAADSGPELCDLIGPDQSELPAEMWPSARALRGDFVRDLEIGLRHRRDGNIVNLEVTASPILTDGLSAGQVMVTSRDVTQRKRDEEQLREQAEMLDLAPVLVRDLNDRIIFWNTGAARMYGWSNSEAMGRTAHELLSTQFPESEAAATEAFRRNDRWEGELTHRCQDGREIVVVSNWILHRDRLGAPKAIIEVNSDITAQKEAEHEVRRLNAQLEARVAERTAELTAVNKELEAFSYSVSHDLRAPLRHINGFSLALLEDYEDQLDDEGKMYLTEVRAASQEMAQLIDDVLQLARVTRSEMILELVDLSRLAEKVVSTVRKQDPERRVAVAIEPGLELRGDKRLLEIALVNLLGNAWKFTSKTENARIELGRTTLNQETVFFVRDNGAGFDQAFSDKLFRAFQRLHTGAEFEGTGIGLANVQRVLNRHGGRVWAEGQVGHGATFYFTIPQR